MALLENPPSAQIVKVFPIFYGTQNITIMYNVHYYSLFIPLHIMDIDRVKETFGYRTSQHQPPVQWVPGLSRG